MEVHVKNCKDRNIRKLVKNAAHFYGYHLMSKRLADSIAVEISFVKDGPHIHGECEWMDDNWRPKEFAILIHKKCKTVKKTLETLAHEFVHVKQWAKGEMRDHIRDNSKVNFKGIVYSMESNALTEYYNYPWEIEAHGMEKGLYHLFWDHLKAKNAIVDNKIDFTKI